KRPETVCLRARLRIASPCLQQLTEPRPRGSGPAEPFFRSLLIHTATQTRPSFVITREEYQKVAGSRLSDPSQEKSPPRRNLTTRHQQARGNEIGSNRWEDRAGIPEASQRSLLQQANQSTGK